MGKDYYCILGVDRSATECQIRKAYRTKALQFHPDKNQTPDAEENFKEISEAYDVLGDPEKRRIFDRCGEEGLKRGGGSGPGRPGCGPGYSFNMNPMDMFESLFGSSDRFHEIMSECQYGEGFPESFCQRMGSALGSGGSSFFSNCPVFGRKDSPINKDIFVGLHDLYLGCKKKLKVKSTEFGCDGKPRRVCEKVVEIEVKPGWKDGTKVTFPELGDKRPGRVAADIIFQIKQNPHPHLQRCGNNLYHKVKISLKKSLLGFSMEIPMVDGTSLPLSLDGVITPCYQHRFRGRGMPLAKTPSEFGDFIVCFEVCFPEALSEQCRKALEGLPD